MRQYGLVSGLVFSVIACAQLLRLGLRAQVVVGGHDIPLWASGVAALVAGTLAVWAFRARADRSASAV